MTQLMPVDRRMAGGVTREHKMCKRKGGGDCKKSDS